jgi:hypothetical protein
MAYQTRKDKSRVFVCTMHTFAERYDCKSGRVEERDLCDAVLAVMRTHSALASEVKGRLKNKSKADIVAAESTQDKIRALQLVVEKAKIAKVSLWEQFHNGEITREIFKDKGEKLTSQIEGHERNIAELQAKAQKLDAITQNTNPAIERYAKLAGVQELTYELVNELIIGIHVHSPERIEIIWKFGEEFERLTGQRRLLS